MNIVKGNTVFILSGKDKGKKGKVIAAYPEKGTILVEGVNVVSKHQKPRRQGEQGGIIKKEIPIRACKAMVVCGKCDKPTRIAHKFLENGTKKRVCKHCGADI